MRSTILVATALCFSSTAYAAVHYVNADLTTGTNNGTSWANAYRGTGGLQAAIVDASDDPGGGEVWAKASTIRYSPITLANNVRIYGGFAGNETSASQSSPLARVTIIDGGGASHVVASNGNDSSAVLRGFTIQNGYTPNGEYYYDDGGAGIIISNGSPQIVNCAIRNNFALWTGAGVAIYGGNPHFVNCTFYGNGNWSNVHPSPPPVDPRYLHPETGEGGAVFVYPQGHPEFDNCLFYKNAANYGGAIYAEENPDIGVVAIDAYNCTFTQNSATIYSGGAIFVNGELPSTIRNCIFWNNIAVWQYSNDIGLPPRCYFCSTPSVRYCDIQDYWWSYNNNSISVDPKFVNIANDNFALQSTSPCKDTGVNELPPDVANLDWDTSISEDVSKDLELGQRRVGTRVDMGAYEYQDLFASCNASTDCITGRVCCSSHVCQACCSNSDCHLFQNHLCKIGATNTCVQCLSDSDCPGSCCINGQCGESDDCDPY